MVARGDGLCAHWSEKVACGLKPIVYSGVLLVNSWIGALQSDGLSWVLWGMAGRALGFSCGSTAGLLSLGVWALGMAGEVSYRIVPQGEAK